jgi:Tol biopolymer transport system component/DNA-binding winged helix-turn-helix (wHTH) protein
VLNAHRRVVHSRRQQSMLRPAQNAKLLRFGVFELDLRAGELRKAGLRVKLQGQPFQVLAMLLESPGKVVTREELQQQLWQSDTFVDFEHGLNTAVKKLRQALDDDSDNPRFVETLPRRGYRFIAPVSGSVEAPPAPGGAIAPGELSTARLPATPVDVAGVIREVSHADRKVATERPRYKLALFATFIGVFVALTLSKWRPQPTVQVRVMRFVQLTNDGQAKSGPMATDGVRIYFNETLPGQLQSPAQVSTAGGEATPFPTPLNRTRVLDLSPDGAEILLANQEDSGADSLWVQSVAGGSPRRLGSEFVHDAAWGADGETVIYANEDGVFLMNKDGTLPRKLLMVAGAPDSFTFSPNGQALRFSLLREGRRSISIMETSTGGTNLHQLFPGCCGKWTPDGRYFVYENEHEGRTDLWAMREDGGFRWRKVDRQPVQLTAGPLDFKAPIPSKNGKEIFAIGTLRRAEIVRYDSHNHEFVPYLHGVSAEGLSFSRDARWVTYISYPDGTLWRSKINGSDRLQLTFPPLQVTLPRWSPDGRQIAFLAHLPGRPFNIYLMSADGGTPQQILLDDQDRMDADWSPDGNSLVFGGFNIPNTPISIVDLKTTRVSTLPGSIGLFSPRWSPDGRYICAITAGPPFKLILFDFTTQKWMPLFGSDMSFPTWSHDGRYIYFEHSHNLGHNGSQTIDRIRLSDHNVETVADLKRVGRMITGTFAGWSGLAPDDSPLVSRDISTHEIYALQLEAP